MFDILKLLEALLNPSPAGFILALILVISVPIFLHTYLARESQSSSIPAILLIGPSGAGKTAVQVLFERGESTATHTSQTPLAVECALPDATTAGSNKYRSINDPTQQGQKRFLLIDTPGHGKLRHHTLENIDSTKNLRGIIFVVDAANLAAGEDGLRQTSEYLHDTLLMLQKRLTSRKTSKAPKEMHVLVAANKTDLFTALPASMVRSTLEKEIGKIRESRAKGLLDSAVGTGDSVDADADEWLGETGSGPFKFEQLAEFNVFVELLGGFVNDNGRANVQKWWDWVGERL